MSTVATAKPFEPVQPGELVQPIDLQPVIALVENRTGMVWFLPRKEGRFGLPETQCREIDKVNGRCEYGYERVSDLTPSEPGYAIYDASALADKIPPDRPFDRVTMMCAAPLLGFYRRLM